MQNRNDEDAPAGEQRSPEVELVSVCESGNPAIIPIIESVLRDAGIDFVTSGNLVQALQGAIGSPFAVPVEFWVRREDEADARSILDGIENAPIAGE